MRRGRESSETDSQTMLSDSQKLAKPLPSPAPPAAAGSPRRGLRWLLEHTFLMAWRMRPLGARELAICLFTSLLLSAALGGLIGLAAAAVAAHGAGHWLAIEARSIALAVTFGALLFATNGLSGVYLAPLTLRLPPAARTAAQGAMFLAAGALASAAGLRAYTPITGLPVAAGLLPALAAGGGLISAVLGVVVMRFHQLEAEMRAAYAEREIRQRREAELNHLAQRAEIAQLAARLQPHFLFNTLNSIAGLVGEDAAAAEEAIARLAQMLRYTLRQGEAQVPLRQEWQFALDYLALARLRLGERLQIQPKLAPAVAEFPVPALLLQPLVENAVVHGIAPWPEGGWISLRAAGNEGGCRLEIENRRHAAPPAAAKGEATEHAAAPAAGNRQALAILRRRLELLYPQRHRFDFEWLSDGARVTIEIDAPSGCWAKR